VRPAAHPAGVPERPSGATPEPDRVPAGPRGSHESDRDPLEVIWSQLENRNAAIYNRRVAEYHSNDEQWQECLAHLDLADRLDGRARRSAQLRELCETARDRAAALPSYAPLPEQEVLGRLWAEGMNYVTARDNRTLAEEARQEGQWRTCLLYLELADQLDGNVEQSNPTREPYRAGTARASPSGTTEGSP